MNIREIKALAGVLRQSDLTALEVTEGETKIRLERRCPPPAQMMMGAPLMNAPLMPPAAAPEAAERETNDFNNLTEVNAPMVGVYYAAPSPDSAPYVQVGDMVEKGQVVCLIEAMKLMNDITAPVSGKVVDICVQDGAVLEYGQTILKIM